MKPILKVVIFAAVLVTAFGVGFGWRDLRAGTVPSADAFKKLVGTSGTETKLSPTELFKKSYSQILSSYYKPVDAQELKYAAMGGLLSSQGDPHTIFMEPKLAKEFSEDTKGNFVGVGARLLPDPLGAKVMSVFADGPAFQAGVKEGDIITAVDGKSMSGIPVQDIVDKIRGKEGTIVRLQITRAKVTEPIRFAIKRGMIIAPSAEGRVLDGTNVGYLFVTSFSEPTSEQFENSINKLESKGIKGLIIDLRNNPGGLLETAREMLSLFAADKVVVKMKMRNGREEVVRTFPDRKRSPAYPIVLLINEDSASAAEIFSGVMQDYRLATLVGEHSYGKASVQNVFMLVDGSSAKITIARYYLPRGVDIGRKVDEEGQFISGGLVPDVKVQLDQDSDVIFGDPKTDNQLQRAIEVIREKQGAKAVLAPAARKTAILDQRSFGLADCA